MNTRSRADSPQGAAVFIISTALNTPQLPNFWTRDWPSVQKSILNLSRELASFLKIRDNNRNT